MTTSYSYIYEPSKKEILERLFKDGHITFNEMWTLLQDNPDVRYIPMPYQKNPTIDPWNPFGYPIDPPIISYDNNTK